MLPRDRGPLVLGQASDGVHEHLIVQSRSLHRTVPLLVLEGLLTMQETSHPAPSACKLERAEAPRPGREGTLAAELVQPAPDLREGVLGEVLQLSRGQHAARAVVLVGQEAWDTAHSFHEDLHGILVPVQNSLGEGKVVVGFGGRAHAVGVRRGSIGWDKIRDSCAAPEPGQGLQATRGSDENSRFLAEG